MEITSAFVPAFIAAGTPHDFAVFSRYDLRQNLVTVYFSPSAAKFARALWATPCDKPTRYPLRLMLGDARAWDILFPESKHLP